MTANLIRTLIPVRVKRWLRGNAASIDVVDSDHEVLWERSRERWRNAEPQTHLTWGREVTGDNFVLKMDSYGAFGAERSLLEIGPGYGRLLRSMTNRGDPFKRYLGVDLSSRNIAYLKETFADERIEFQQGDMETLELSERFDSIFSSLTFKHLFPSFERLLLNASRSMAVGGMAFFDLIEGAGEHFENDGVTYLRHYTKDEVLEILERVGLKLVNWDEVLHTPQHSRLLVVATKPN
jgi:SAM-dependent methyltransferase